MEHSFDIDIAVKVGVNAAVIYNNILHWVKKNAANGENFHDGHYWTYNSKKAFAELFPYMTDRQVRTALEKLKEEGYILTANYNANTYDRTLWYTVINDKCIGHKSPMEKTPESNPSDTEVHSTIYRNKPDINTDINGIGADAPDIPPLKVIKHKYGQYKNVVLSDAALEKLQSEFPNDWEDRIERLSEYMQSHGRQYKDHLATIRCWARKDKRESQEQPGDGWDYIQAVAEGRAE